VLTKAIVFAQDANAFMALSHLKVAPMNDPHGLPSLSLSGDYLIWLADLAILRMRATKLMQGFQEVHRTIRKHTVIFEYAHWVKDDGFDLALLEPGRPPRMSNSPSTFKKACGAGLLL